MSRKMGASLQNCMELNRKSGNNLEVDSQRHYIAPATMTGPALVPTLRHLLM